MRRGEGRWKKQLSLCSRIRTWTRRRRQPALGPPHSSAGRRPRSFKLHFERRVVRLTSRHSPGCSKLPAGPYPRF
jgi:hypothetical protein